MDPELLEAMQEVDALTPETPPIAPPMCRSQCGTHICVREPHTDAWCTDKGRTLWPNPNRTYSAWRGPDRVGWIDTGPRPQDVEIADDVVALPNGTAVTLSDVQRRGWRDVLEENAWRVK
jgi:hypothetical protein